MTLRRYDSGANLSMDDGIMRQLIGIGFACVSAAALAGCGGASGGDPGAKPLPMGESCGSIRSELNRLDSKGVPALVERASNGGKLNASQRSDVDSYNNLLNQYLGARCHV
ncbi:MAG: hypothetical protein AB7S74_04070 [Hyphomicrobium sp.]